MRNYSQNLFEVIRNSLPEGFADKAASMLGESPDKTHRGMTAALPGILSGLDNVASTDDGARRLASAVDSVDDSLLGNVGRFFDQGGTSVIDQGTGMLRSVLGSDKFSRLTGTSGRLSGLSGASITSLVGMLVPIIFGVLNREKRSQGLDATGLANLLAGQRSNIASAMADAERMEPLREVTSDTFRPHVATQRTETHETAHAPRARNAWALPLALLAGLGFIWYLALRPRTEVARMPDETVHAAGESPKSTATFEQLRAKYQSVLERAREEGVNVTALYTENGKLIVKGIAPSIEAVSRVRSEIQRINPSQDDIVVDFPVTNPSSMQHDHSSEMQHAQSSGMQHEQSSDMEHEQSPGTQ